MSSIQELKQARESVRERMRHLGREVEAHERKGQLVRAQALKGELMSLKRRSESLKASIKQAEAAALIHRQPKRVFSQQVER